MFKESGDILHGLYAKATPTERGWHTTGVYDRIDNQSTSSLYNWYQSARVVMPIALSLHCAALVFLVYRRIKSDKFPAFKRSGARFIDSLGGSLLTLLNMIILIILLAVTSAAYHKEINMSLFVPFILFSMLGELGLLILRYQHDLKPDPEAPAPAPERPKAEIQWQGGQHGSFWYLKVPYVGMPCPPTIPPPNPALQMAILHQCQQGRDYSLIPAPAQADGEPFPPPRDPATLTPGVRYIFEREQMYTMAPLAAGVTAGGPLVLGQDGQLYALTQVP